MLVCKFYSDLSLTSKKRFDNDNKVINNLDELVEILVILNPTGLHVVSFEVVS